MAHRTQQATTEATQRPTLHALIIASDFGDLERTTNDAVAMAAVLQQHGFTVTTCCSPGSTRANILRKLDVLVQKVSLSGSRGKGSYQPISIARPTRWLCVLEPLVPERRLGKTKIMMVELWVLLRKLSAILSTMLLQHLNACVGGLR